MGTLNSFDLHTDVFGILLGSPEAFLLAVAFSEEDCYRVLFGHSRHSIISASLSFSDHRTESHCRPTVFSLIERK